MNFGQALETLKQGGKVTRTGWNGSGLWLELQRPDANSKMTLPYIYINYPANAKTTPNARVPWLASQTDMLADDWDVVNVEADDDFLAGSKACDLSGDGTCEACQ